MRFIKVLLHFYPIFRQDHLPDDDGRGQGLDARHILQEREDRAIPQHPAGEYAEQQKRVLKQWPGTNSSLPSLILAGQPVRARVPQRRRPLQHPRVADVRLLDAPRPLPARQADVQPGRRQL